ncbi:hypothetical protein H3C67_00015 [Candidatus Dojkabacteria bacterium]|uniref:Uncharacterized protein n=1 Tax=Candidatus Dojkabacteria bacterium TaxID=2099670 RepID=A0A952DV74_9BACT|nr:hypothetical protein [Candidatus Dojkabacteria bacterium]
MNKATKGIVTRVRNTFSPESLIFLSIIFVLALLHYFYHDIIVLGHSNSIFYLNEEFSLGTLFSCIFASFSTLLALKHFRHTKAISSLVWSILLFGLCLDEYLSIHEYLNEFIKRISNQESLFVNMAHYSWVISFGIGLAAILFIFFIQQLRSTKSRAHKNLLIAAVICYSLVLPLEVFGGQRFGRESYIYFILVEEVLEMLGTVFLVELFIRKNAEESIA